MKSSLVMAPLSPVPNRPTEFESTSMLISSPARPVKEYQSLLLRRGVPKSRLICPITELIWTYKSLVAFWPLLSVFGTARVTILSGAAVTKSLLFPTLDVVVCKGLLFAKASLMASRSPKNKSFKSLNRVDPIDAGDPIK